jgi:hypothetical protein
MPRANLPIAGAMAASMLSVASASAAGIECGKVETAYDHLFLDANARMKSILAEYKALPASASEKNRDASRKRFCAVAGEAVGLYKFVQALTNDCAAQGADVAQLTKIVNEQLGFSLKAVTEACGQ